MKKLIFSIVLAACALTGAAKAEVSEITITRGDGIPFLPLMIMEKFKLVEKHAEKAGVKLTVVWVNISGSGAVNDALLSGSAHFISGGPPGMLTLWDRTKGRNDVRGVGTISSLPMYLNTKAPHLKSIDDVTEADKIAVTGVKISIPSIIMQMYARKKYGAGQTFRYDPLTGPFRHADGLAALLSGSAGVTAHYTSAPFHQRELKDPAVRTIMTTTDVMGGATTMGMMVATEKFEAANPLTVKAVTDALDEAQQFIGKDKMAATEILLPTLGRGWDTAEVRAILDDPDVKFVLTPLNVKKYADFMADIGSLKNRLGSWKDMFFVHVHHLPGS